MANESTPQVGNRLRLVLKNAAEQRKRKLAISWGIDQSQLSKQLGNEDEMTEVRSRRRHLLEREATDNDQQRQLPTYSDSRIFLCGTQSRNPQNDYCQHFVDTGQRPQNFIHDHELEVRFYEAPRLKGLIECKNQRVRETNCKPMYHKCDLRTFNTKDIRCKFDVILIEPPLEEYQRTRGVTNINFYSWDEIKNLAIEDIAAQRSFVFLWCGSSDGLDRGRECLKKWGFRRCEDICWIMTNIKNPGFNKNLEPNAIFQRTKEHCLMGIKGTVKRCSDGDFIHTNIDIDLIISEDPEYGSIEKPEEIFHIIEHFCLGRRRLHVFGRDSTIRPGWLTIGPGLTNSNFDADKYLANFEGPNGHLTGTTTYIEKARPKSPPKNKIQPDKRQEKIRHRHVIPNRSHTAVVSRSSVTSRR